MATTAETVLRRVCTFKLAISSQHSRVTFQRGDLFPDALKIASLYVECLRLSESFQKDKTGGKIAAHGLADVMTNVRVISTAPSHPSNELSVIIEVIEVPE